jgi:glutaredoxin 3
MNVLIYSTPECPWCKKIKEFLKINKIKFKEIDVSNSSIELGKMIKKSGQQGVPVIDIGGEIIVGFDEKKLKKLLRIK